VASVTTMNSMFRGAYTFNQCLSSWADKTPPNVSIGDIFEDSGCPDKSNPDPSVGPWCQGADEQCFAPPTAGPIALPTAGPIALPTAGPIALPTAGPIALPTAGPIALPTTSPTKKQKKTSKKSKK